MGLQSIPDFARCAHQPTGLSSDHTCDWTTSQPADQPPALSSRLLRCSALHCSVLLLHRHPLITPSTRQRPVFTAARRSWPRWQENQQVCPKRVACFDRPSQPALITPCPCAALALPCLLLSASGCSELAQPSPAQPLKQSINHSLLALAPRRRPLLQQTVPQTQRATASHHSTSPSLAKTATLLSLSAELDLPQFPPLYFSAVQRSAAQAQQQETCMSRYPTLSLSARTYPTHACP